MPSLEIRMDLEWVAVAAGLSYVLIFYSAYLDLG
jgi:hypothetical protein